MSTKPRLPSAVPGESASFYSVMTHAPEILDSFGALYGDFWQRGVIGAEVKEMTRIRNARITDCGF